MKIDERLENRKIPEDQAIEIIKKAKIRIKFQLYGFLKNLQFFEPFLLIILLNWGINLFQIGLLFMIQEIFTYTFEIPSGFFADNYGKKNQLLICFIFYILSFIFYFLGPAFPILIIAVSFYGLGEAFRSGTHKAIEMEWLERQNLQDYKALLYGMTRSWSLLGSSLNAILAILLIFFIGDQGDSYIFLFAIIPFALDFGLVLSYPKFTNGRPEHKKKNMMKEFKEQFSLIKQFFTTKKAQKGVLSSTLYDTIFKLIKDYIQPIISIFIGVLLVQWSIDEIQESFWTKAVLSILYTVFYLLSAFATRKAHSLTTKIKSTKKSIDLIFDSFAIIISLVAIFIILENPLIIIILYMIIYMIFNLRRPIIVGYIGEMAPKEQRATIFSIEAQIKSFFIFIFAPLFGFIAENFNIQTLFILIAIFMISINFLLRGEGKKN